MPMESPDGEGRILSGGKADVLHQSFDQIRSVAS
jgi:hypothetical protein